MAVSNDILIADKSRGIAYITYDANGNPKAVYFTNGHSAHRDACQSKNETRYTYSASGQKLHVEYNTAVPNITRPFGATPSDLTLNMTLHRDKVDYLLGGSLVVKSGTVDKYLFDGGYAKKSSSGSNFIFYYYNKDHLGNNRELVSASRNAVVQVTRSTSGRLPPKGRKNYYPSGTPYADDNAEQGADIQPYKYNGKELDLMHGLNTYDYGARQYNPVLARWDRVDPLCEKYYSVSPYVYCMNNPINMIDPNFRLNI